MCVHPALLFVADHILECCAGSVRVCQLYDLTGTVQLAGVWAGEHARALLVLAIPIVAKCHRLCLAAASGHRDAIAVSVRAPSILQHFAHVLVGRKSCASGERHQASRLTPLS